MRICKRCKISKSVDCFSKEKRAKDGVRYQCKQCDSETNKNWRNNLSEDKKKKLYANNRKYYENNIKGKAIFLMNSIKERYKKSGRTFSITYDFLLSKLQNNKCEVTGIVFRNDKSEKGGITPFSPSVDRIKSNKNYDADNIQLVCSIYNIGKSHHNELDFIAMCLAVAEKNRDNQEAIERLRELRNVS